MQGWLIFKHAVLMLVRNWTSVLRIFLFPFVAVSVASTLVFIRLGLFSGFAQTDFANPTAQPASVFLAIFGLFVLWGMVVLWTAVAWHRFILLEEPVKGVLPSFHAGLMFGYFWRFILIVIVLAIPAFILLSLIGGPEVEMTPEGPRIGLSYQVFMMAISIVFSTFFYLLSPILPAIAIGEPIDLSDAVGDTVEGFWSIMICVAIVAAVATGIQYILPLLLTVSTLIVQVLGIVFQIGYGLFTVSILTTLYGHYVQGREL